jgi:beta-lactamase
MKSYLLLIALILPFGTSFSQSPLLATDAKAQQKWVDETYQKMTLEEKIGQLFMVSAFSSHIGTKRVEEMKEMIKKYHIGGIIFSKGGPKRQARLTNEYQSLSKIPLFMAMDAEWGLAMRLDSTFAFPWNMTLGAIKDNQLIERTGKRIGLHCKQLGMQFNFAPDIDINTNPDNPIIGNRSFGEDKENVAQKGIAFARGMQSVGVLGSAKHFPGHGDTAKDSHKTLPTISFTAERLDEVELYPFKRLAKEGIASVMVGHLNVPALEPKKGLPSSLSSAIISQLLKKKLGYEGLIFTDALGMKGVSEYLPVGEVEVEAFLAGNDILLMPANVAKGVEAMKKAYHNKRISEARLALSVKKILMAKYKVGLTSFSPLDEKTITEGLHTAQDDLLTEELFENALTVAQNKEHILPLKNLEKRKIAYVKFGNDSGWTFYSALRKYAEVTLIEPKNETQLYDEVAPYETLIIGFHKPDKTPWDAYKFSENELKWLEHLAKKKKVILTIFTRPYAMLDVKHLNNIEAIVFAYQNHKVAQEKAAQLLFGAIEGKGVLPVSAHPQLPVGTSLSTTKLGRLGYGLPESVGIEAAKLARIDSIAQEAIVQKMTPGMQVLVAKNGKVVYRKNFGTLDYNLANPVNDETIYDLASLTKILATLPELMRLYTKGDFKPVDTFADLLPKLKDTNKAEMTMKEVLSHYAQFQSWIPFFLRTLDANKNPLPEFYSTTRSDEYPTQVAKDLYLREGFADSIYKRIDDSDLIKDKKYLYSDLPYYYFKKFIEKKEKKPLEELVQKHFYRPLGAHRLTYLPLERFPADNIAPAENEKTFRNQELRGYVHDQGAAMLGGVGGHAGLFGTADDVAKLMQMYLQQGYYGGDWLLQPQAIKLFNTCFYCTDGNRRGLGFDKPQLGKAGPTCGCVPMDSFGHTGFTGTFAWADPTNEIVVVILSNRTYPSSENKLLITKLIRQRIQEVVYSAMKS